MLNVDISRLATKAPDSVEHSLASAGATGLLIAFTREVV